MKKYNINMQFLKKSRKKLCPGDVFVFKMPKFDYVFGRVICTDAEVDRIPGLILIYIYKAFSEDKNKIPFLDKNNLVVPPIIMNRQGWLQGYFEIVINKPLVKEDILSKHCFKSTILGTLKYYDEYNNELIKPTEPCGQYGVSNHRVTDDEVSRALGISLAPED
jgi:hypothetical protein